MRRAAALTVLVAALALLAPVRVPRAGADPNPADAMLDRARTAIADHEFSAEVAVRWSDGHRERHATVGVVAVDGTLRVDDGAVVARGGRAWMRTDRQWSTLWADARDPREPSIAAKYAVVTRRGPEVVGRRTRELRLSHDGRMVERIVADRATGLILVRERFDDGRRVWSMRFTTLRDLRPRWGTAEIPAVGPGAPRTGRRTHDEPRRVGRGFVLVDVHRLVDGETQLRYSDGLFSASVFREPGDLDWRGLPGGGEDRRFGSVRTRRYATSAGWVIVWESDGRSFACVTDAPTAEQAAIVTDLAPDDEPGWSTFVRFVTGPFSWS